MIAQKKKWRHWRIRDGEREKLRCSSRVLFTAITVILSPWGKQKQNIIHERKPRKEKKNFWERWNIFIDKIIIILCVQLDSQCVAPICHFAFFKKSTSLLRMFLYLHCGSSVFIWRGVKMSSRLLSQTILIHFKFQFLRSLFFCMSFLYCDVIQFDMHVNRWNWKWSKR